MGEKVRLSDGRWVVLPEGMSAEDRDKFLIDIEASLRPSEAQEPYRQPRSYALPGDEDESSRSYALPGDEGPPPQGGITSLPSSRRADRTRDDWEGYTGERTIGGHIKTLAQAIPIGIQQAVLLGKQGIQAFASPDEDTEGEKRTRQQLEDLILKIDPNYRDAHVAQLGMGLGTMAGMIVPGALTALAAPVVGVSTAATGLLGLGASAISGGFMNAGDYAVRTAEYEEDTGEDVSTGKELLGLAGAFTVGLSEAAPVGRLGRRAGKMIGLRRGVAKTSEEIAEELLISKLPQTIGGIARSAGRQALEEGAQEAFQGFSNSAIARVLYDDDAMSGVVGAAYKEALLGGEVGAIADLTMSLVSQAVGGRRRRRIRNLQAAGKRIGEADRAGRREGTIESEFVGVTEVGEDGEYLDQSTEAEEIRDGLRFTEESLAEGETSAFTSDMSKDADVLDALERQKIDAEFTKNKIPKTDPNYQENLKTRQATRDRQRQEQALRHKTLKAQIKLAGSVIAAKETGVDPLLPTQAEKDAEEARTASESVVETVVAEAVEAEAAQVAASEAAAPEPLPTGVVAPEAVVPEVVAPEVVAPEVAATERIQTVTDREIREQAAGWLDDPTDENVEGVVSTAALPEPETYDVHQVGAAVHDALTPGPEVLRDTQRRELLNEALIAEDVLDGQRTELAHIVAARAVIDGTLDPSDPSAIAAQDFVKEQRKSVEDEINRLKKLDSKPDEDQLAEIENEIVEIVEVQKTNNETRKALEKVVPPAINKAESKKVREKAYLAAMKEAETREGRELNEVEKTEVGIDVDVDMQDLYEGNLAAWEVAQKELSDLNAGIENNKEALNKLRASRKSKIPSTERQALETEHGGAELEARNIKYINDQLEHRSDIVGRLENKGNQGASETFVGRDASGNDTRILGVNEARDTRELERLKRKAAKKGEVARARTPDTPERELRVGLPDNAADLEKHIEGVVDGTDHNAALNADDLDLSLLERRLPYQGQRDALEALRARIISDKENPGTQPRLTAKEVRDSLESILSLGVIDELESSREHGVAITYDPEEGPTTRRTAKAKKAMDIAKEKMDAVQRRVDAGKATQKELGVVTNTYNKLSAKYQESFRGEERKEWSRIRYLRVLQRKEAIPEKSKDLPVGIDVDDRVEAPLYNLANVHTIMRRMLAHSTSGTENSVIVSEGSDVQTVWNNVKPKERGTTPLGVQTGWNYGYLKEILLGDSSEGLTSAERKEIDLLVPKFKVKEDGTKIITQGADLFTAWRGGPARLKGREVRSQIIHAEQVEGESVEGKSLLQRVLSDVFDPKSIMRLGVWLDRYAVDKPAIRNDPNSPIPQTAPPFLVSIRRRILEGGVTLGVIKDALIYVGMSEVVGGEVIYRRRKPDVLYKRAVPKKGIKAGDVRKPGGEEVVADGFIRDLIDSTMGTESVVAEGAKADEAAFARLDESGRYMLLARIIDSKRESVHTEAGTQKPVGIPASKLSVSQRNNILLYIRAGTNRLKPGAGRNLASNSNDMKALLLSLNIEGEPTVDAALIRRFVESVSIVEKVGTNGYRVGATPLAPKVVITEAQIEDGEASAKLKPIVEKGMEQEAQGKAPDGSTPEVAQQWKSKNDPNKVAPAAERTAELVNAEKRVIALKNAARRHAINLFGRKKGSKIVIEIEAAYDSIYAQYVDKLSNKNSPAYVDTYGEKIVLSISNLEAQYAKEGTKLSDVKIETLVRDAMLHEGVHVLFLKGVLTATEKRNLWRYGQVQRVPEAVAEDAVNIPDGTRMTWSQWIEAQPGYSDLSAEERIEEMQVQILDALAKNLIPKMKSAGAINDIKQHIVDRIRILVGIQEEGSLSSILSVFDKVQDRVEMDRRLQVAEDSALADLRYIDRAAPEDLTDLVEAIEADDEAKIKAIAKKIATERDRGVQTIPATQQFLNQMMARQEIDETPKGITAILNGAAVLDGTISPAALDEYFRIQSGKPPYVMSEPRRREMGRRRTTPSTPGELELIATSQENDKGRPEVKGKPTLIDSLRNVFSNVNESGDGTPEGIKKTWEYNAVEMRRFAFLDGRLAQAKASLEGEAFRQVQREAEDRFLDIASEIDSITAWRYNDQSQSYMKGMLEHGPVQRVGRGFKILKDRIIKLERLTVVSPLTGEEIVLSEEAETKTQGLAVSFEEIADDESTAIARQYQEAARIMAARGERDSVRSKFVETMVAVGFDRKTIEDLLKTKDGQRLGGQTPAQMAADRKAKKEGKEPDKKKFQVKLGAIHEVPKPKGMDATQERVWDRFVGEDGDGQIGVWQRRYDLALLPGNHPVTGLSQDERYKVHINFFLQTQAEAKRNLEGMAAKVIKFWANYRAFNYVQIEEAYKGGIIDEARKDLYLRMSFMPFYRDLTGWGDASVMEYQHSPESIDRSKRRELDSRQKVAPSRAATRRAGQVASPMIDRNVEGSWAPISQDLMGTLLKNSQAMLRDSMWNNAAAGTVEEGLLTGAIREQRFLTINDIDENDRLAFEEQGVPWDATADRDAEGGFNSQKQREIMYERRNLWTPERLSFSTTGERLYGDLTIRVKQNGEARYYRTMDDLLALSTMAVRVSPSETLQQFFQENLFVGMDPKWAKGVTKLLIGASGVLREAVTMSPVFQNVNVLRDSMQASVTFGGGVNLTRQAFTNFYRGNAAGRKQVWDKDLHEGRGGYRLVRKDKVTGKYEEGGEGVEERGQRLGLNVAIDFVRDPARAFEEGKQIMEHRTMHWDTPLDFVKNSLWTGPVRLLKTGAGRSEIATRLAVYDKVMEDTGGNHAMAFKQALEIINYGRRGNNAIFGVFTAMSPFMAGRIQGLDVTWRTHRGHVDAPGMYMGDNPINPEEVLGESLPVDADGKFVVPTRAAYNKIMFGEGQQERALRTFKRGIFLATMSMLYTFWRYDDEDYKNAREDQKNNYWLLPWGVRIPIPFEVGTIYKVIPEQLTRMVLETEHDAADVTEEIKRQLTASLGMSPIPQLFKPAYDAIRNQDRYQKDDIVPQWMADDLLSSEQIRSNTSYVARGLSGVMNRIPLVNNMDFLTSPMKMEYMLRQAFGTMGAYAITTTDAIWAHSNNLNRAGTSYNFGISSLVDPFVGEDVGDFDREGKKFNVLQRIAQDWNRIPVLGDLLYDPREGGGYQEDFYEWIQYLDSVVATLGQVEKRDPDRAASIREAKDDLLKYQSRLRHYESQMAHWRDDRDFLLERSDLSRQEKNERLVSMYQGRDKILSDMTNIMSDIKGGRTIEEKLAAVGLTFRGKGLTPP